MIRINRLGSRFFVNKISQSSERHSAQMQAAMNQKDVRSYASLDDWITKILLARSIWPRKAVLYEHDTVGTFILKLLHNKDDKIAPKNYDE